MKYIVPKKRMRMRVANLKRLSGYAIKQKERRITELQKRVSSELEADFGKIISG